MKTLRDYINLINEEPINIDVRGIQQDARVRAYQDAIAAGKSEEEAQNAEAAAGNLAGAQALQQQGDAAGLTSQAPVATATPVAEPTATVTQEPAPVQAQPAAPAPKAWNKGVLGMGSQGPEVKALQKSLGIPDDGIFGPATKNAVMALQKQLGVAQDGAYGPATRAAHDKMRSGSGAQPATQTVSQTAPNQVTQTQQTYNATQGVAQGRIDPNSLRGQTTLATPQVAPPAGNPSGVGKKATYTPDEIAAASEVLKDPKATPRDKAWAQGIVNSTTARPVQEMSKADAKLLDQMLTIAKLR